MESPDISLDTSSSSCWFSLAPSVLALHTYGGSKACQRLEGNLGADFRGVPLSRNFPFLLSSHLENSDPNVQILNYQVSEMPLLIRVSPEGFPSLGDPVPLFLSTLGYSGLASGMDAHLVTVPRCTGI